MALYVRRTGRRLLAIVILLGVGLVLSLFYALASRTNHFVEDDPLQRQQLDRFESAEPRVHVVGRDKDGNYRIRDSSAHSQISMEVDVNRIELNIHDDQGPGKSSDEDDAIRWSESEDIEERSKFQMEQVDKYCRDHQDMLGRKFHLPSNKDTKELLYRHMLFNNDRRAMFCFVEKVGCTDMKRMWFVSVGELPLHTIHDEWVDLKYLEKGIRRASLLNKSLDDARRLNMIETFYKFMIVRHPLERLVSGFRNKIEPPFSDMSVRFPNYIKLTILQKFRNAEFEKWMNSEIRYNLSVTFDEFIRYIVNSDLTKINPHLKPVIHTCHPCRIRYNFYGNFRTYSQDALMAMKHLHIDSKFYRNKSLHSSSQQTTNYLGHYYDQLNDALKVRLFWKLREELEFYYTLYPRERNSHVTILRVDGD